MTMKRFLILALAVLPLGAYAQERTAGSNLETQMTWGALSSQITTVKQRADGAHVRVDQVEVCGRKGMVYSPGNGADGQGCVTPATAADVINQLKTLTTNLSTVNNSLTNTTKNIHNCVSKGQSFNGTKCVDTSGSGDLRWAQTGKVSGDGSTAAVARRNTIAIANQQGANIDCPIGPGGKCSTKGQKCYELFSNESKTSYANNRENDRTDYGIATYTIQRCE
jgi:hypothetical protein